jgi:CheY-like chemotaxis protein
MAMLQKLGWQTVLAGDGKAAVEAASAQSFQLILMDAQLPGIDGYQAARLIREREQPRGQRTIILGCSGNGGADSLIACRAAGMDGHLVKPLQLGRLRSTLGRWWQHPA